MIPHRLSPWVHVKPKQALQRFSPPFSIYFEFEFTNEWKFECWLECWMNVCKPENSSYETRDFSSNISSNMQKKCQKKCWMKCWTGLVRPLPITVIQTFRKNKLSQVTKAEKFTREIFQNLLRFCIRAFMKRFIVSIVNNWD